MVPFAFGVMAVLAEHRRKRKEYTHLSRKNFASDYSKFMCAKFVYWSICNIFSFLFVSFSSISPKARFCFPFLFRSLPLSYITVDIKP